jgi:type II secretory pathway component PulF
MEQLDLKIESLEKKIDELQRSINKLMKIFFWTLIATVALFILPLIGLLFVIPQFLSTYSNILQ